MIPSRERITVLLGNLSDWRARARRCRTSAAARSGFKMDYTDMYVRYTVRRLQCPARRVVRCQVMGYICALQTQRGPRIRVTWPRVVRLAADFIADSFYTLFQHQVAVTRPYEKARPIYPRDKMLGEGQTFGRVRWNDFTTDRELSVPFAESSSSSRSFLLLL